MSQQVKNSLTDSDLNLLFAQIENTRNELSNTDKDFPYELTIAEPILKIAEAVPTTLDEFRKIPIVGKHADKYGMPFINTINQFLTRKRGGDPMELEHVIPNKRVAVPNTEETEIIRKAKDMGFTAEIASQAIQAAKDIALPLNNFEMLVEMMLNLQNAQKNNNKAPIGKETPMSASPSKSTTIKMDNKASPVKKEKYQNKAACVTTTTNQTSTKKNNNVVDLDNDSNELTPENECKICFTNEIDCLLLPCAHFVICSKCTKTVNECPVCRTKFVSVQKFFRA